MMNAVQHAEVRPLPEIAVDRAAQREILWQRPPLTACAQDIEDRVHLNGGSRVPRPLPMFAITRMRIIKARLWGLLPRRQYRAIHNQIGKASCRERVCQNV